jgi:hypothetical protein
LYKLQQQHLLKTVDGKIISHWWDCDDFIIFALLGLYCLWLGAAGAQIINMLGRWDYRWHCVALCSQWFQQLCGSPALYYSLVPACFVLAIWKLMVGLFNCSTGSNQQRLPHGLCWLLVFHLHCVPAWL